MQYIKCPMCDFEVDYSDVDICDCGFNLQGNKCTGESCGMALPPECDHCHCGYESIFYIDGCVVTVLHRDG